MSPSRSTPSAERLRAEVGELRFARRAGDSSHTPARFFDPASVRTSSPPPWKRSRKAGVFGP